MEKDVDMLLTPKHSSESRGCELFAMVVEPLTALAVGEEAVTGSALGRALERGLVMETG